MLEKSCWHQVYLCGGLGIVALFISFYAFRDVGANNHHLLQVVILDVGQGDAIFIEAPNGNQMIIDGGPGTALSYVLPNVMKFSDRSIDTMIITNPDADHIGGFTDLLARYEIGSVIEPGTLSETETYSLLQEAITAEGVPHLFARAGMQVILDQEKNIYFEILFPDRDVSTWERNDGSLVGRLVYGETSFLLMGDATVLTEGIVASHFDLSGTDVLKTGHHGSRTSSGIALLQEAHPDMAIISAGKDNRYGHPHKEVIDRLVGLDIPYLGTYEAGTIECRSDGMKVECI